MLQPSQGPFIVAEQPGDITQNQGNHPSPLRLSLVVPTYNEREYLPRLLAQISVNLDACLPQDYEIIVVDDDSCDHTWALALELTQTYPALRVMRRLGEQGLATAVVRGWQMARGEILGVIDADGQHPTEVIQLLLKRFETQPGQADVDLAIASRYGRGGSIQGWSGLRWLLSRGAQGLGWLLLPDVVSRVSDPMSGFFLLRRRAIARCSLHPRSYKLLLEILVRGKVGTIAEVGYTFRPRQAGLSKVSGQQYWDYLLHLSQLWWVVLRQKLKSKFKPRFKTKHKS